MELMMTKLSKIEQAMQKTHMNKRETFRRITKSMAPTKKEISQKRLRDGTPLYPMFNRDGKEIWVTIPPREEEA